MIQKTLTFQGLDRVWFEERPFEVQEGTIPLTIDYSTISPGTELFCIQEGKRTQPGYIMTGHAEDGTLYFVFPSMAESSGAHCNLRASGPDSVLLPLAANVAPEQAGFLRFLNIGLHPLNGLAVRPAKVLVTGLGPVGNLAGQSATLAGADVLGIDLSENRRRIAARCGLRAEAALPAGETGFDLVIDTVCNGATLKTAAEALAEGGVCSMIGIVKPAPAPEAAIFKSIWEKNLQFCSGWEMKHSDTATRNNLACAMNRLAAGAYRIAPLLTGVIPADLDAIARAYRNLAERPDEHFCYVIDWRSA